MDTAESRTMGKAASTREAILERAVDLASKEGLEGSTIGRLASDLQMSKSGLFAHFGSKQDLQLATIGAASARFYEAVIAPAQDAPEGAPRLRAYCERYLDCLQHGLFPGGCFWAAAAAEFDDRPGLVRDAVRAAVAAWLAELERQAAIAGVEAPADFAFEIYAVGLGANACSRLLCDASAFERARAAIERRLPAAGVAATAADEERLFSTGVRWNVS
jgi:AcrR family transcriptional regulator